MTMNFSSCSVFPATIHADDDFAPTMRHRSFDGFGPPYWRNWEVDDSYDRGGEADMDGSFDPVDQLPSDPFGMELSTTFTAAVAGWIGDFENGPCDYEMGGDDFVAGLSYYWNKALASSSEPQLGTGGTLEGRMEEFSGLLGYEARDGRDVVLASVADLGESSSTSGAEAVLSSGVRSIPHEGILFSLGYLGVQDLLSVEMVCRSLNSAVQNDTLLWRFIHIESPLSERITDEALLRLTERAQRSLQCLSLVGCSRITDDGLKRVLERNPRLKKLGVPGCVRLSIEGLINNLKALKSSGMLGIKQLKLGRLFTVSPEHYEELKLLVDGDKLQQPRGAQKPWFYHHSCQYSALAFDDERAIDIEMCPGCQKFKLVYNCPLEACQARGPESCRACNICIARCFQCGRCIDNCRYVETFCLEFVCSGCCKNMSQSPERLVEK